MSWSALPPRAKTLGVKGVGSTIVQIEPPHSPSGLHLIHVYTGMEAPNTDSPTAPRTARPVMKTEAPYLLTPNKGLLYELQNMRWGGGSAKPSPTAALDEHYTAETRSLVLTDLAACLMLLANPGPALSPASADSLAKVQSCCDGLLAFAVDRRMIHFAASLQVLMQEVRVKREPLVLMYLPAPAFASPAMEARFMADWMAAGAPLMALTMLCKLALALALSAVNGLALTLALLFALYSAYVYSGLAPAGKFNAPGPHMHAALITAANACLDLLLAPSIPVWALLLLNVVVMFHLPVVWSLVLGPTNSNFVVTAALLPLVFMNEQRKRNEFSEKLAHSYQSM